MTYRQLQKYKLLEAVGEGGMSVVYRGIDTDLDREVAVKVLHPHLAKRDDARQRFQREAQAVAKLKHDNIIEIYDYSGENSDESYIVTEFIHGQTLRDYLAHHPISHPEIAAMIVIEVCNALAHAHSLAVIHRDIKPENIMVRRDGRIKLTDFGIAQIIDLRKLTVTGQLLGSPAYMSPELIQGHAVDFRSDVFSVGTLLYQLATAEMPFSGKNPHEVLKRIADGRFDPPEVVNSTVDAELGGICRKALAHNPEQRYPDIQTLRSDLTQFIERAGLTDPRNELADYFADPVSYSQTLQVRVVSELTTRAATLLKKGKKALALRLFDRVLCIDPGNRSVTAILDRLSQRQRWIRIAAFVVSAMGIFALGYMLVQRIPWWHHSTTAGLEEGAKATTPTFNSDVAVLQNETSPKRGAAISAKLEPRRFADASTTEGDAVATSDATDNGNNQKTPKQSNKTGPPAAPYRTFSSKRLGFARKARGTAERIVEIVPQPKAVDIWVNGRRVGAYGPDLRFLSIPRGPSRILFRNEACCFDQMITLGATERPKRLAVRLRWKPGRVLVRVTPAVAADVIVGNIAARTGQTVEVPIPSYSNAGTRNLQITVSADGYATHSETVVVYANQTANVTVNLRPL